MIKAGTGAAAPSGQRLVSQALRPLGASADPRVASTVRNSERSESVALRAHCSSGGEARAARTPPLSGRYSLIHEGIAGKPTPARVCGGQHAPPT